MVFCKGENAEEKDEKEIKEYICNALETKNLNFLLGSGCSIKKEKDKILGCPLMIDLYNQYVKEIPKMELLGKKIEELNFGNNLESLFEYMLAIQKINEKVEIDKKIDEKIQQLKEYIYKNVEQGTKCGEIEKIYMEFYSKIFTVQRKNPINIFTTNYDLYNEISLDKLSFLYNNGFTGTYKRKFNPIAYNYIFANNINIQENLWENVKNYVNLVKLHGSIDWVKEDDEIIEENILENKLQHLMIYPTPMKDRSTLATPYSDLFRIMQNKITQPNTTLIVIGYSFSDEHINRIILNALTVESFNLIIFGDSKGILKLKEKNIPRVSIIYDKSESETKKHYFSEVVKNLLPDISKEVEDKKERQRITKKINEFLTME